MACEQLERKCYCIELDPKYCDVIVNRYIAFKGSRGDVKVERNGNTLKYSEISNNK